MEEIGHTTPERVKMIQVIETKSARGVGTNANPVRIVTQYWSLEGKLLAENDPSVSNIST